VILDKREQVGRGIGREKLEAEGEGETRGRGRGRGREAESDLMGDRNDGNFYIFLFNFYLKGTFL
jgi:hypothetical protein